MTSPLSPLRRRTLRALLSAVAFSSLGLGASAASAADLTTFENVEGDSGYMLLADPADATSVSRIHVLPRLCGPTRRSPSESRCEGASIRADAQSASVTWVLESRAPSAEFLASLHQELSGRARREGRAAPPGLPAVDLVRARDVTVRLRVDGRVVASRTYEGSMAPHHTGTLEVAGDRAAVDAIKRGHFALEAELTVPFGSYSSLSMSVADEAVSRSRVEAFKEVLQSTSTSSGHFLFHSWKRSAHKRLERQTLNQGSSESSVSTTSVLLIDPDAAMDRRLDELLGFVEKERSAFFASHRAAAAAAEQSGRPDIAKLHVEYLQAVAADNTNEQERILRMVTALASEDVAGFLAAGVAFSNGGGNSTYRFHAVSNTSTTSQHQNRYHEVRVTTQLGRYNLASSDFPDVPASLSASDAQAKRECFGAEYPNRDQATGCLLRSVKRGDLAMASRALQERAYTDGRDPNRRTPLMHAALQGDDEMVALLLRWGASAALVDADGLCAGDLAYRAGHEALAKTLGRESGPARQRTAVATPMSIRFALRQPGELRAVELRVADRAERGARELAFSLSPGTYAVTFHIEARVLVPYAVAQLAMQRGIRPASAGPGGVFFDVSADIPRTLAVSDDGRPFHADLRVRFDVLGQTVTLD